MTKLEEIRKRWARMSANRYGVGRMETVVLEPPPYLCVISDRTCQRCTTDHQHVVAVMGPLKDAETLEDAIAYIEAPTDVAYLLKCLDDLGEPYELGYSNGFEAGQADNRMRGE